MAHKAESFKVATKKTKKGEVNVIVLYTNVKANPAEQMLIDRYLSLGYEPMFEEKKEGTKVAKMRKDLEKDPEALEQFNEIYKKDFFEACKFYADWKKKQN